MVASCTPWVASVTVSRSGHLVALTRLRKSVSSASGTLATGNGRIASACSLPRCVALDWVMGSSFEWFYILRLYCSCVGWCGCQLRPKGLLAAQIIKLLYRLAQSESLRDL